jgi:DNA-binding NtrC family response regulator
MDRVLFLDDDDARHRAFRYESIGLAVDAVHTADQACRALDARRYRVVLLDHDLADQHYAGLHQSGLGVARHLVGLPGHMRPDWTVVHSLNPAGADAMVSTLKSAGLQVVRAPFGTGAFRRVMHQLRHKLIR